MFSAVLFSPLLSSDFCFMVRISEVLKSIDENSSDGKPMPFSIKFFTWDKKKNDGGELKHLANCVKSGLRANLRKNGLIGIRVLDSSDHIYPVHINLISEFNGQKVLL